MCELLVTRGTSSRQIISAQTRVTKYIRIGIGDKNDNPPYFEQASYEAEVNEDEDIQHTVITVTAKDKDEFSPELKISRSWGDSVPHATVAERTRYWIVIGFVTSSSPVPLKTRRVGERCTLNLSRAERPSVGVVVRRWVPAQVSSTSLDHGSKLRGPSPKALV
ncbi:neural-cadherin [Trichonephila clavipes]|nr:neural-cadherin [Trichonephila clavipes]